ncbi:ABC transporter ATP-binding protein [Paenibacillus sp. URB8-2]|uniref:ABC transporter ATP-binding protein n=1 Tax=Paenibacillus sp. URB8-2 TaxID=2741301 RepID=UPI0015BA7FBD|nr:ABC transporter ATP-binding protein [Paenibacillus sp. URB8-2]BCG60782.1 ABC transporter ATP-binding protein [Paenibacillus sp. URB8-2]
MTLIDIRNASFAYEEKEIFNNVNLSVSKGEICCLMGPNGCGKSTLLDCILGFLRLSRGEIFLGGRPFLLYKIADLARQFAYVPQLHTRSFPYTVEQIVLMGRTTYGNGIAGPNKKDRELAFEALETVGMLHLAERPYTKLSGGELQLVILARALVQETPAIIMDEPTAHLDFRNELLFMETVAKLVQQKNVGILMATHSPNQAFYFENKGLSVQVSVMGNQTILQKGTPDEVLTEETIRQVYRIEAKRAVYQDEQGIMRQIIPRGSL